MKNTLIVLILLVAVSACKKDEFESTPQIEFVDINPNFLSEDILDPDDPAAPKLIFNITDAEGDFGSDRDDDSSWIYIKNLQTGELDSTRFPDLSRAPKKDFKAEVSVALFDYMLCFSSPPPAPTWVDSTYFEVYVTDAKKHKSNTITTTKPALIQCP